MKKKTDIVEEKKVLVITDYQNDFIDSTGAVAKKIDKKQLKKSKEIHKVIQALIDQWHAQNWPVIFLVSDYSSENFPEPFRSRRLKGPYGDTAKKGSWGYRLYRLKSNKEDIFVEKNYFDGFYKTKLESILKTLKIKQFIICGINTDVCVFHTAIGASIRGYDTSIIKDAVATTSVWGDEVFLNYLEKIACVRIIFSKKLKL